jgi:2-dehydropantoate 2-reductase
MRVGIVGCGAIGGWLAAGLAAAGCRVSVLARGATLAALQRDGLQLRGAGAPQRHALPASDAAEALGPQDHVVVAVKAQSLPLVAPAIRPLLGPETTVVTAMNGLPWWFFQGSGGALDGFVPRAVDPEGAIARVIGPGRVIGAVVHASARVAAPAVVELVKADRLLLGAPPGGADARAAALAAAFREGGIPAAETADIRGEIWSKLWGNASLNPVSVLTSATTGRMLDDPEVRETCLALMREMAALGERAGLRLPSGAEERIAVTRRLGDFRTSMLQDFEAGRPLELEPILGVLAEMAQRLALPVPTVRLVLGLVRLRSASARDAAPPAAGPSG